MQLGGDVLDEDKVDKVGESELYIESFHKKPVKGLVRRGYWTPIRVVKEVELSSEWPEVEDVWVSEDESIWNFIW